MATLAMSLSEDRRLLSQALVLRWVLTRYLVEPLNRRIRE